MKNTFKNLLLLFVLIISLSACSKDDDKDNTDIRDQAVGTYNYTLDVAYYEDGELQLLPDLSDSGIFTVKKNESDSKMIDFAEDGKVFFSGSKIAAASNGFTFDVPSQIIEVDELGQIGIIGLNLVELGSTYYNGVYFNSEKKIHCFFQTTLSNEQVLLFEVEAIKQ